jgi:hypothetical protein
MQSSSERSRRFGAGVLSAFVFASSALSGCATSSQDVAATYVSPTMYGNLSCDQLNQEAQRIQARVVQLGGRLDEAAQNDKVLTGVGLILFWPALFALGGTKQTEAEYARLRGEYDAVQQASVQKNCANAIAASAPAPAASVPTTK